MVVHLSRKNPKAHSGRLWGSFLGEFNAGHEPYGLPRASNNKSSGSRFQNVIVFMSPNNYDSNRASRFGQGGRFGEQGARSGQRGTGRGVGVVESAECGGSMG